VACFNIVSTLVMAVKDKSGDIAVLRTLGAKDVIDVRFNAQITPITTPNRLPTDPANKPYHTKIARIFNIVSTLVMAVKDKSGDIAVLRTLGAKDGLIRAIEEFMPNQVFDAVDD
jgi:predicted lysophospholipase L1 biosynthesis ABC-type transport system permease subunit